MKAECRAAFDGNRPREIIRRAARGADRPAARGPSRERIGAAFDAGLLTRRQQGPVGDPHARLVEHRSEVVVLDHQRDPPLGGMGQAIPDALGGVVHTLRPSRNVASCT